MTTVAGVLAPVVVVASETVAPDAGADQSDTRDTAEHSAAG